MSTVEARLKLGFDRTGPGLDRSREATLPRSLRNDRALLSMKASRSPVGVYPSVLVSHSGASIALLTRMCGPLRSLPEEADELEGDDEYRHTRYCR